MNPADQHIDDLFRRELDDRLQQDAWDVPSDEVWSRVALTLKQRRRRRRAFWWFMGSAAAGLIIAAWLLGTPSRDEMVPDADASMTAVQTPGMQESTGAGATDPTADDLNATGDAQDADVVDATPSGVEAGAVHQQTSSGGANASSTIGASNTHASGQVTSASSEDISTRLGEGASAAHSDAPDHKTEIRNEVVTGVDESAEGLQSALVETVKPLPAPRPEQIYVPLLTGSTIALASSTKSLNTLPSPVAQLERPESASHASGWSLSVFGAPSWGTRRITVPADRPRVRKVLLQAHETPVLQFGFGAEIEKSLGTRWTLSSGIEYSSFLLESHQTRQVRFTRAGEQVNDRGNLENRLALSLNSSFGEVSADVIVERSSGTHIDEHRFIDLELRTSHAMKLIQVPFSVGYEIPLGEWALKVKGGPTVHLLLDNDVEFNVIRSLDQRILDVRVAGRVDLSGTRKTALGYHFGAGLHRDISERITLFAEPVVSGYVQSLYRSDLVSVYPALIDIHLGMQYQF